METTKENSGLLHRILPPRLEDAGLEDPALPPHSIHEAFLKAAASVKSRASALFPDDDDAPCIDDPRPAVSDALVGAELEHEPPGACTVQKGCEEAADEVKIIGGPAEEVGDELVIGDEGVRLGENSEPCVDQLQGLGIEEKEDNDDEEEEEEENNKKPTLTEGYV